MSPPRSAPPAVQAAPAQATETLASGVVHRAFPLAEGGGIDLIDCDLTQAAAHPAIVAEGIARVNGHIVGKSYTPREWLDKSHALAAINGGYFGRTLDDGREEIVTLLVQNGRVRRAAPPLYGQGGAFTKRGSYARAAFGMLQNGTPSIAWAATAPRLIAYDSPRLLAPHPWRVQSALGCGPMLIKNGSLRVTDYAERLVSSGPRARTFVAYDNTNGKPCHFVLGIASGSEYKDLARFLLRYFPRYDHTRAAAAMCLDGGSSTQLSYRVNGTVQSPRETGATVPNAIVLLPNRR